MAAASVGTGEEADRLCRGYQRYRRWLQTHQKEACVRHDAFTEVDTRTMLSTQSGPQV